MDIHKMYVAYAVILAAVLCSTHAVSLRERRQATQPTTTREPRIIGVTHEVIWSIEGEDNALLPCEIKNRGSTWLHWFRDGERLDVNNATASSKPFRNGNQRYQIVNSGLKLKNVKKTAAGKYRCELTLENGEKEEKIIDLTVQDRPESVNQGTMRWAPNVDPRGEVQIEYVELNQDRSLKCTVYGEPNITVHWIVDDQIWDRSNMPNTEMRKKVRIKFPERNNRRTILVWKDVQEEDDGKSFTCSYTQNVNGTIIMLNKTFEFQLREESVIPPTIVNDSKRLVAYLGSNFTYECMILKREKRNRVVHFVWGKFHGIDESNNIQADNLQYSSRLKIINVTMEDEGQYICYVYDQKDRDFKVFNLTVVDPSSEVTGRTTRPTSRNNLWMIVGIVGIVVLLIVTAFTCYIRRRRQPVREDKVGKKFLSPSLETAQNTS